MINDWCKEAGGGVYYTIINKDPPIESTKIDNSNIYWLAFKNATDNLKIEVEPIIMTGVTDARFLRLVSKKNIKLFQSCQGIYKKAFN